MGRRPKELPDKINTSEVIYKKSNRLINAKGRSNSLGLKLFAISVRNIELSKDGSLVAHVSGTELRELFNRKSGSFYTQIRDLIKPADETKASLLDWRMYIEKGDELRGVNIITDATFKDGQLDVRFNSLVKDEIYDLKGNYSSLNLLYSIQMSSPYGIRFYEIFKSHMDLERARTGNNGPYIVVYDIDELKRTLGIINPIGKDKGTAAYQSYTSFRRNVLDKALSELNTITNIHCIYEGIRSGKGGKIVGVRFTLTRTDQKKKTTQPSVIDTTSNEMTDAKFAFISRINDLLSAEGVSLIDIKAICDAAEYNEQKICTAYELEKHAKNVENFTAWMIAAIKGGYQPSETTQKIQKTKNNTSSKRRKRKDSFDNFEEREYDIDAIEKKLLGE